MAVLRNCPKLVKLVLDDCLEVTDACLVEGLARHPNLRCMREISIARCCELTDVGVVAMMEGNCGDGDGAKDIVEIKIATVHKESRPQGARSLKVLNVTCLPMLTEASLMAVAKNCPFLECLKAADSDAVTDASIIELAKGCDMLSVLDVSECMHVTEKVCFLSDFMVVTCADPYIVIVLSGLCGI